MLSRRVIEPLKLALAIAIIYAIAFHMGWEKPYWATVSAVSVNLLSTGLTLHRGLIRTLGTAAGGFLGLIAIGIFPQERWAYLCLISVVLFILGYKATGKKEPYLYLIILITFIVVMAVVQQSNYASSGDAFEVVMLRVTQTLMGSVVMILIMVYVFPYRTVDEFEELARKRWDNQRKLYNAYRGMLFGEAAAADTKHLRMEDTPLLQYAHFKLHGAEQDSFEMLEVGHDWHHYLDLTATQCETLEALRQSLVEVQDLELTKYLPDLEALCTELDRRFEQTERMLAKKAPSETPTHIAVSLDETETRTLLHFQEAAVRVIKAQLEKLEEVSLSLCDCIAKIRMFERPAGAHDDHHGHGAGGHGFALDPFRLRMTTAFVVAVWVSFLLWIFVYDMPRGSLFPCFVVITASIAMYRPEANQQHYSLQHYLQTVLWMATALATTLAVRFAFIPWRPDVMFMRVLEQFFRHADFLLSANDAEGKPDRSIGRRLRSIFWRHSLLDEAERLALFAGQVSPLTGQTTYRMLRETPPEQVQELVRSVYALGHRIEALVEAREAWQSNLVDKHLMDEKREWHRVMQEWFRRRPGTAQATGPTGDLPARLARLETRIDEAFERIGEGELSTEDYENFYRRLANYRGLSEAASEYARLASGFDWPRWRETRF